MQCVAGPAGTLRDVHEPLDRRRPLLSLRDYLRPVYSRWPLVLAIIAVGTGATYAYFVRQPDRYTATTKVFFQDSGVTELINPSAPDDPDRALLNQATLLSSRDVATAVARRLRLRGNARALLNDVRARPSGGSDFILIAAERGTPEGAAGLANAFARAFIEIRSAGLRKAIEEQLRANREQYSRIRPTPQNQEERSSIASTIRQLALAQAIPATSARQIDPALPPTSPTSPKPMRNALFALALSALAAIAAAFLLERFDRRIKRLADLETAYGVPMLAGIPATRAVRALVDKRPALAPQVREAFRSLRTGLLLASVDRPFKTILVTSAVAGEGKSTVVRNLALTYQEAGSRVAVADFDLRRPRQADLFRIPITPGFTDVLTGDAALDEGLRPVTTHTEGLEALARARAAVRDAPRARAVATSPAGLNGSDGTLGVLPSGPSAANPPALLSTERARTILTDIADQHDVVIVDSSPYLTVSDAAEIAPMVDAIVIVVRLGVSTRTGVQRLMTLLDRTPGATVVGIVANHVTAADDGGYYEYHR